MEEIYFKIVEIEWNEINQIVTEEWRWNTKRYEFSYNISIQSSHDISNIKYLSCS